MKMFGKKQPPDEDVVVIARLSAVAARFKPKASAGSGEEAEPREAQKDNEQ